MEPRCATCSPLKLNTLTSDLTSSDDRKVCFTDITRRASQCLTCYVVREAVRFLQQTWSIVPGSDGIWLYRQRAVYHGRPKRKRSTISCFPTVIGVDNDNGCYLDSVELSIGKSWNDVVLRQLLIPDRCEVCQFVASNPEEDKVSIDGLRRAWLAEPNIRVGREVLGFP